MARNILSVAILVALLTTVPVAAQSGAICGAKFHDADFNRIWDIPNESGLGGWLIVLTDPEGGTRTTTTDADGLYCFTNLPKGTYSVMEIAKPGWTQTAPSPSGAHTVVLKDGETVLDVDFGNGCCAGAPVADLVLKLNTGWDQITSSTIVAGDLEDDWRVTLDASGGLTPRKPGVVIPISGWLPLQTDSMWITAIVKSGDPTRPGSSKAGLYDYTYCFCLAQGFSRPRLNLSIRADDRVREITLNGKTMLSDGPRGTFHGQPLEVQEHRRRFFKPGKNCLTVQVEDTKLGLTGLNLVGEVTAEEGVCCPGL